MRAPSTDGVSVRTVPEAFGVHADSRPPEAASNAARRVRELPLTLVNDPPAYTEVPLLASARTVPETRELKGSPFPVVASTAATPERDWPPTVVKSPPA